MAAGLCSFSYSVGDAFFREGGASKLEWCLGCQEKENGFEDKECLDQTLKNSFLYLFWDWVRVYMRDNITYSIDFVD